MGGGGGRKYGVWSKMLSGWNRWWGKEQSDKSNGRGKKCVWGENDR